MTDTALLQSGPRPRVERRSADTDEQVVELWLFGKAANTQAAYRTDLARFSAFARCSLREVTLGVLQDYADELAGSGLARSTQARRLAVVKSLLSFCARVGYTRGGFNVGAALKLPAFPETLAERIVTAAKVKAIIDREPNARNKLLLRLLYLGGLRRGEASQLRWRNLSPRSDDDGGFATVFGKGGKTRSVLLPAALWRDLQAMRTEAAGDDDPVFVGRDGAALSAGQLWRVCKRAGVRAGVPGFSPHWLRHAGASHAIDNGAPISVVRDCLGHASLATTSRYVHVRPGESLGRYLPAI